jgi:hypothetical protein
MATGVQQAAGVTIDSFVPDLVRCLQKKIEDDVLCRKHGERNQDKVDLVSHRARYPLDNLSCKSTFSNSRQPFHHDSRAQIAAFSPA